MAKPVSLYWQQMPATKKSIISLPNQHLRQRSRKVGIITPSIQKVVKDMQAATLDWEKSRDHEVGVALAAVQIDKPFRIIVIRSNPDDKSDRKFSVFINPEITKHEGSIKADYEGCLSVPDIYGKVPRHSKIRVKAIDQDGKPFKITAEDFLARVFQHEIDHLNGKVFIDHIKNKKQAFYKLLPEGELKQLDYEKDIKKNSILWQ